MFTFLVISILCQLSQSQTKRPNIAVIGSGIGGSSLSHYMDEIFQDIDITLYEKNDRVGGRSNSIQIQNKTYETGASFICDNNYNMMEFIKIFDLPIQKKDINIGFWKQNDFKLKLTNSKTQNLFNLLYKYGFSILKLKYQVSTQLSNFNKIYENQNFKNPVTFNNLTQFLKQINLYDYFLKSTEDLFIKDLEFDESFVREALESLISDYYNQNLEVNGFTGFIVSTGFTCDAVQVRDGIDQICKKIVDQQIKKKNLQLKMKSQVQKIDFNNKTQKFTVQYNDNISEHDIVILATPLEISNITLGDNIQYNKQHNRPFQQINKLYFTADINNHYFFESDRKNLPDLIISPDRVLDKISVISKECHECIDNQYFANDRSLYSVSANQTIPLRNFDYLFYGKTVLFNQTYPAYPKLHVGQEIPKIILDQRGLYYLNSMESLASAQELQTISAKNIANLIQTTIGKNWTKKIKQQGEL